MDAQKVDTFMLTSGSLFPEEKAGYIRERLLNMDESQWGTISTMQFKNPTTALILSIFLGELGIDRFYIGNIGMGIGKLIATCFCGVGVIWAIIDWFMIMGATRQKNYEKLAAVL